MERLNTYDHMTIVLDGKSDQPSTVNRTNHGKMSHNLSSFELKTKVTYRIIESFFFSKGFSTK